jgi:Rad3-related DNA helicase
VKIYASAPVENRGQLKAFINALKSLTRKAHKVIDIYGDEQWPLPTDINYHIDKFKQAERAIKEADIVLVEVTYPGRRIGFELARALDERKVVIALHDEKVLPMAASILGNTSKNLIVQKYSDENIDAVIGEAIERAKEQLDTKFILIISPQIDKYLEWAAAEKRMHKAQIVREAIEAMMNKDKDYKEFLKSID